MDDTRREGIINAIKGYEDKQKQIDKGPTRKNAKPEKEVEKEILAWAKDFKMSLHIIEAKATYNPNLGAYRSKAVASGFLDAVGNYGPYACFVEFKAKGKRHTLRENQRDFISKKIFEGAFACVTDSVVHLSSLFVSWLNADENTRIQLLLNDLPKKKQTKDIDDGDLFDD